MDDLISREEAVNAVKGLLLDGSPQHVWSSDVLDTLANVPAVEECANKKWFPFVKRYLTEEEKAIHPDWVYILDGEVPEDGEEILLYRPWRNKAGYIIEMDTYCNNGDEVYLDGAGDIVNGMYWMHKPEPPKEE